MNKAVLTPPICKGPVGLGAKRTRTFFDIVDKRSIVCHPELVSGSHDTHPATIDKYSYVASLDEVKENDYNLNIPRYVDTFEEEEPVDITAVAKAIKQLDHDMQQTDEVIAGFCNELGIETPF